MRASPPRVLVLLASHNGASFLPEQLNSLARQQGVALRVRICDDASRDGSPALLARWCEDHRDFDWEAAPAALGSAARNFLGLLAAADLGACDYLAFCDQDDVWEPDRLSQAAAALQASGADLYSCATRAFWPDGRERTLLQSARVRAADFLFEGAGQGCSFVLTAAMARRIQLALRPRIAAMQGVHYHDWAVYAAVRSLGGRWIFDPAPRLRYRQHAGNDTGARASGGGVRRRLALITSGWYREQVELIVGWTLSVEPGLAVAHDWSRPRSRLARACWIARHGRRRRSDRIIQVLAVLAGHL